MIDIAKQPLLYHERNNSSIVESTGATNVRRVARAWPPSVGRIPRGMVSLSRSRNTRWKKYVFQGKRLNSFFTFLCASAANPDLVALLLAILFTLDLFHWKEMHKQNDADINYEP